MPRSPSSLAIVLVIGCGPATTVHPETVRSGCGSDQTVLLGGQDDVAAVAGCTTLPGLTIRTAAPLRLEPLRRLVTITGDLVIGPSVGLDEATLPELRTIGGTLRVISNGNLHGLFLPKLERAGRIEVEANVAITSVSLPRLAAVEALVITDDPELELIDVSSLATVGGELVISDNPKLVMIEAGKLAKAPSVKLENNRLLPAEQADALRTLAR